LSLNKQSNCKCKGRGFYLESEVVDGRRHIALCDHEPDKKYKRMYETVKRIQDYEPIEEEK
jgi:hypothetical protein